MTNPLLNWWSQATADQKRVLAELSGSSVSSLHQMSRAYRTDGELRIRPATAIRLEEASKQIEGLPVLRRELLTPVCANCEYLKRCQDETF